MTTSTEPKPARLNFHELIEQAGHELHHNLTSGYTDGYERTLADRILATYLEAVDTDEKRDALVDGLLEQLLGVKMNELITVDCLLDEGQPGSYVTTEYLAQSLHAEIRRQDGELDALHRLITGAIVGEADLIRSEIERGRQALMRRRSKAWGL